MSLCMTGNIAQTSWGWMAYVRKKCPLISSQMIHCHSTWTGIELASLKSNIYGIIIPCTCVRSKVISFIIIVRTKIAILEGLGIWATRKPADLSELAKKTGFSMLWIVWHGCHECIFWLIIVTTPMDPAHCRPCAFCSYVHNWPGRDCQQSWCTRWLQC